MEHQDWKPVIWNKTQHKTVKSKKQHNSSIKQFKQLDNDDPDAPPVISHNIKMEIQKARMAKNLTPKTIGYEYEFTC